MSEVSPENKHRSQPARPRPLSLYGNIAGWVGKERRAHTHAAQADLGGHSGDPSTRAHTRTHTHTQQLCLLGVGSHQGDMG